MRWAYRVTQAISRSGEYPDRKNLDRKQRRHG
jgi:hypothetical protein